MKKKFMVMLFALTLCVNINVNAKNNFSNDIGKSIGTEYNLSLTCADNYTEDEFWGCIENGKLLKCGNVSIPTAIPPITRTIVTFIKIAVPLVLIIIGMIDILKAVIATDEKKIKEAQATFIKRLIPAALVFLIVTIMQFVVNIVADNTESESLLNCIDCMVSDADKCISQDVSEN